MYSRFFFCLLFVVAFEAAQSSEFETELENAQRIVDHLLLFWDDPGDLFDQPMWDDTCLDTKILALNLMFLKAIEQAEHGLREVALEITVACEMERIRLETKIAKLGEILGVLGKGSKEIMYKGDITFNHKERDTVSAFLN